jgi:simple sugar transport system permease protein
METYALLIAATLNAGTVLAIAALGLLINEKAGVVNLGAEGMMLCAAIAGFAAVVHTGSDLMGFLAGMGAGALLGAIFGAMVIYLSTNQYATGLALSLFGVGFSAFVGISYVQEKLPPRPKFEIPFLADIPLVGSAFFKQHPLVYGVIAFVLALIWFFYKTRTGLVLRSVGESPESAHALGYPVRRIRFFAVIVGGALCGLAGAYISVVGFDHLCHLAAGAYFAWGLLVWRCHHAAVSFARFGCASTQSVAVCAALPGNHCGVGLDLQKSRLDSGQYACLLRQSLSSQFIMFF